MVSSVILYVFFYALENIDLGTSLVAQWLRLHVSTAGEAGLIPGWGTRIPHVSQHGQIYIHIHMAKYIYIYIYIVLGKTLWTLQTAKGFMIKHLKVLHRPSFLSPHAVIPQSSEHLSNASPGLRSVSEAML